MTGSQWRPCHGHEHHRQSQPEVQGGRKEAEQRLLGRTLGLLALQAIPLTSDLDTGSHGQNTALKTPGVVPAVRSKARPREGQGLALVTQPGRRSCGFVPGCHPSPQHLSCPPRGLRWGRAVCAEAETGSRRQHQVFKVPEPPAFSSSRGGVGGRYTPRGCGVTGPPSVRTPSQRSWAGSGDSQDLAREPRGGGRRPGSRTGTATSPTGPRTSTASGGERLAGPCV